MIDVHRLILPFLREHVVSENGDVDPPKEGRKTTVFDQAFEDLDVGGVFCETVEDAVDWRVMECSMVERGEGIFFGFF